MARNISIGVDEFKSYYFSMPRGRRSIRKAHAELKQKYKGRKSVVSLATIFRHSRDENWISEIEQADAIASQKAMEVNIEKKTKHLTDITDKLSETSDKALDSVLSALRKGIAKDITKPEQILSLVKSAVESQKLKNTLEGNPNSITGHINYDAEDVAKLKNHISELYQSINADLHLRQEEKQNKNKKLN